MKFRIPKRPIILITSIVLGFLATAALAFRLYPDSKMIPQERVHDFGTVAQGRELKHVFTLHRSGLKPIHVQKIASSCGCLSANLQGVRGGWLLEMTVATASRLGPQSVTVTIETDNVRDKMVELEVRYNATVPLQLSVHSLNFGEIDVDKISDNCLDFAVKNLAPGLGKASLSIVDPATPASVRLLSPPDGSQHAICINENAPIGPLTCLARFSFHDGITPPLDFPIRGVIRGDVYAVPEEIFVTWENPSKPFKFRCSLKSKEANARNVFQVLKVVGTALTAENFRIATENNQAFLEVNLAPLTKPSAPPDLQAVVQIQYAQNKWINMPVRINVLR